MSEVIAYHEAGHALVAVLLGGKVKQVTIEPDDDDGPDRQGDTQVLWRRSGRSLLKSPLESGLPSLLL